MTALFFDDVEIGYQYHTPGRTIFEADVVNFVGLSGTYERIFTDLEYIEKESFFGERVVPGPLTWTIAMGLTTRSEPAKPNFTVILAVDKMRFTKPVRVNDTIHVEGEIIEKSESKRSGRCYLVSRYLVRNQHNDVVMEYQVKYLAQKKDNR